MAEASDSHRQILKATSITGLSSVITILLGIVRTKVLAVLLGPAGVGISGMYINIMGTAGTLAGFGLGSSGVRQIAEAMGRGDERTVAVVRTVLWYANWVCGALGCLLLWAVREPISQWLFGDSSEASAVGWLGIGLLLGSVAGSQTALLQGFRRIGDLARVNIISAILGSVFAVGFVFALGREGVTWFVLANPAVNMLIASRYAARLPRTGHIPSWAEASREAHALFGMGFVFMSTGLMQNGVQLAVRTVVTRELGIEAVGQFQAAWSISMQYIGFVLAAMAADYYPRLTATIHNREKAIMMVNQQAEIALLLAGPVLLGMFTLSPLVIKLLYSSGFTPAADILRWQVMGDLIKIFVWPIGFILLARGDGRTFFLTELSWNICYIVLILLGIKKLDLTATGTGFLASYIMYYTMVYIIAKNVIGFRWSARNKRIITGLSIILISLQLLANAPSLLKMMSVIVTNFLASTNTMPTWISSLLTDSIGHMSYWQMSTTISSVEALTVILGMTLTLSIAIGSANRLNQLLGLTTWLRRKLNLSAT